jgi:hypothetical protein
MTNTVSFSPLSQCLSSDEPVTSNPMKQAASIALVAIPIMYACRNSPSVSRFFAKGMELGRSAYKYCSLALMIQNELQVWEQLRDCYLEHPPRRDLGEYGRIRKSHAICEPASAKIIASIFDRYIGRGSILELGSNQLNDTGESYLARLLPKNYRKDLTYSDYLPQIVKNEKGKTKRAYLCLDASCLAENLAAASKTNVVAVNVFDTISRSKLEAVVRGIHHVLKNNGNLVVLSDLPFDQSPLIEQHSKEDNFLFFYVDGNDLGVKTIPRDVLLRRAEAFGAPFVQWIESLLGFSHQARAQILMKSMGLGFNLCSVLERICNPEEYERVDHKQSYIGAISDAIASHGGFEIVINDYLEDQEIVAGSLGSPNVNVVASDLRIPQSIRGEFVGTLRKNQVLVQSVFHTLIARKI